MISMIALDCELACGSLTPPSALMVGLLATQVSVWAGRGAISGANLYVLPLWISGSKI